MRRYYLRPEELDKRIRIQYKKVITPKETGKPVETWVDLGATPEKPVIYRWAKWEWLHGNEFWQAAAVQSKAVAQVTIRYVDGVLPDMDVIFKDNRYHILPPIDNIRECNRYITFKVYTVESG